MRGPVTKSIASLLAAASTGLVTQSVENLEPSCKHPPENRDDDESFLNFLF